MKQLSRIKLEPQYRKETLAKNDETMKVEEIKEQLKKLNNRLEKLTELYLDEIITRKELNVKNEKLKTEKTFLEEQLKSKKKNTINLRQRKLARLLKDFNPEKLSYEDASKIVKSVINEIIVTKEEMTITLDF